MSDVLMVAVLVLVVLVAQAGIALLKPPAPPQTTGQQPLDDLRQRLAAMETTVKGLPSLWEEERARAERAAARVERATTRARAIAENGAGSEDGGGPISPQLHILDGGPGAAAQLPTVPANVGTHASLAAEFFAREARLAAMTGISRKR